MDINLKQAFDMFIFDRETYCGDNTVKNYKNTLRYFLNYMEQSRGCSLEQISLDSVTIVDLQGYIHMLRNRKKLATHPLKPTEDKPVTNTTIRTYSIDLRTFFNFLYENEYMEKNLMRKFKLIKREKKLVLPLFTHEVQEIDDLYNLKSMTGLRNYCIVHLMLDAGLRSGEVCNLKVSDVSFDENFIIIFDGKGCKDRIVPLASSLKKRLYQYVTLYRPHTQMHNYMFVSVDGHLSPITENTVKSMFSRIRKQTGIERLKPHLLRHTFATSYILGGGDMESLRIFLGHASYETTQTYLHLANTYSRMGSDIYKLDKIFFKRYYGIAQ